MDKLNLIMNLIGWNNSPEDQQRGIKLAEDFDNIEAFLQPGKPFGKSVWENCAKILYKKTDSELLPYISQLLEWLQDLNWPGADIIYQRLLNFPEEKIIDKYLESLSIAKNNDRTWEEILIDFWKDFSKNH